MNSSFFVRSILPSCWFFEDKYLMHPTFPNLPGLLSKYLLSKFFIIAKKDIPGNMFFVKLMNSRLIFWWSRMIFNHCSKRHHWPFEWFSKSSFARSFPIGQEVLDVSQIATAFHKVWPPPFIQSWLWQSCWSTFLYSSNGSFSDAICLGSMSCWSAVFHHKSSHALPNFIELSVCTTFGLCDGSKNFNKNFFRLVWGFCFARIRLNPLIEWQDLAPRQRTDDCFEIHIHQWELCDPQLLNHQTFLHEARLSPVRFLQGALVILFSSRRRNFGHSESENYHCASSILFPLLQDGASLVSTRLSFKSTNQNGRSAKGSSAFFLSSLFLFWFWIFRDSCPSLLVAWTWRWPRCSSVSRGLAASFLSDSCDCDVEDELPPELVENPGTTRGTKLSVLQTLLFPSWLLTTEPLIGVSWFSQSLPSDWTDGVSSRSCTVTNWFKSWTNTCASSWVCTSPSAVNTTVGFWTSLLCPSLLSLIPFRSSCASMLLNQLRILPPLVFSKWVPASLFQQLYST